MNSIHEELLKLANLYCEEQLTDAQFDELQSLLRSDAECREMFLEFVHLHGQLLWNGGLTAGHALEPMGMDSEFHADDEICLPATMGISFGTVPPTPAKDMVPLRSLKRWVRPAVASACLTIAVLIGIRFLNPNANPQKAELAATDASSQGEVVRPPAERSVAETGPMDELPPLKLNAVQNTATAAVEDHQIPLPTDLGGRTGEPLAVTAELDANSDAEVVAEIDRLLRSSWQENHVAPAAAANDHEWVRRLYLTLTGRIPTIAEASNFVRETSPRKRDALLERLLNQRQTAESLAVTWTNLLIGRANARNVDQDSLFTFLLEQFESNKPWMDTVGQLIAAEGRSDQNGATNFLLAHLNDQATPATAVTARLFLGQQVHCTQCHDHPFARERQQQEFAIDTHVPPVGR